MTKKEEFPRETYLRWFESMVLMRKFEEKAQQLCIQQKFGGFLHLYIGQEALVAGAVSAINPDDNMITAYRNHAHPLGKGMDPRYGMAELYGRSTGCSKGKGGSMHFFDRKLDYYGGHGIVGGQIPLGAGLAFADKYLGKKSVTLCYMGDGAVRQGSLHETFNMAMTWKLPVIFIIENNMYAMGTSVERTSNVTDLHKLGLAYDMPSFQVDGMKCETVHHAVAEAADRARKGDGPTLLEIRTYRYKGHSMSDPRKYRTKEEEEQYIKSDPIEQCLAVIRKNNYMTENEITAVYDKYKAIVEDAVKFAEDSPLPTVDDMYRDVYTQEDYPYIMD